MRMFIRFLWVTVLINGVFFLLTHSPIDMADFLAEISVLIIASAVTVITMIHSPSRNSEGFPVLGLMATLITLSACISAIILGGTRVGVAGIGFMCFVAFFCDVRRSDSLLSVTALGMAEFAITVFCIVQLLQS